MENSSVYNVFVPCILVSIKFYVSILDLEMFVIGSHFGNHRKTSFRDW